MILEDGTNYHRWEDGRSNYAWDLTALNPNKMTYKGLGKNLDDFEVFGKDLYLPINGTVARVLEHNSDNIPQLIEAIKFTTLDNGTEAHLKEKPHNLVEVTPGGPFLLRILHQKQVILHRKLYTQLVKINLINMTNEQISTGRNTSNIGFRHEIS